MSRPKCTVFIAERNYAKQISLFDILVTVVPSLAITLSRRAIQSRKRPPKFQVRSRSPIFVAQQEALQ
jgi:hypothetical protein